MQSHKNLFKLVMIFFILMLTPGLNRPAQAASAKFIPKLFIGYNYNDNVDSVDDKYLTQLEMQWVDYLLGMDGNIKSQYYSFTLGGWAGYSQYVNASTELEDVLNVKLRRFDYYNLSLYGGFQYLRPSFAIDLSDTIKQDRRIADIFETAISEFSEIYLYTDNVATAEVRFNAGQRSTFLFRYDYETITFPEPESDYLAAPADVYRHSGFARIDYQVSPKAKIALDLQGGQWGYSAVKVPVGGGRWVERDLADYNYYQALLAFEYNFTPRSSIELSGGAEQRQYFGESEQRDLMDHILPVGRISFYSGEKYRYSLSASGEYAESHYGQDQFFTYGQGGAAFTYYFGKTLYAGISGSYRQDTFNREMLDLENVWSEDRVDSVIIAQASIGWDVLRKYDTPYLSLILGYGYDWRDSNIDGEIGDYVDGYRGAYYSYDAVVQSAMFQVQFNPTIFVGSSK